MTNREKFIFFLEDRIKNASQPQTETAYKIVKNQFEKQFPKGSEGYTQTQLHMVLSMFAASLEASNKLNCTHEETRENAQKVINMIGDPVKLQLHMDLMNNRGKN